MKTNRNPLPDSTRLSPAQGTIVTTAKDPSSARPIRDTSLEVEEVEGVLVYRGTIPFDQLPIPEAPDKADYEWAANDTTIRQQYGGLVVAVCDRKVWGAGKNPQLAWEAARQTPGCPCRDDLVFVAVSALPAALRTTPP
jgi:hypothetical protein